ncbi:hypothetical protein [Dyadobacter sp. SG02]|nr:hypothetical protein [Dyadobacter sp. SG02]
MPSITFVVCKNATTSFARTFSFRPKSGVSQGSLFRVVPTASVGPV